MTLKLEKCRISKDAGSAVADHMDGIGLGKNDETNAVYMPKRRCWTASWQTVVTNSKLMAAVVCV